MVKKFLVYVNCIVVVFLLSGCNLKVVGLTSTKATPVYNTNSNYCGDYPCNSCDYYLSDW